MILGKLRRVYERGIMTQFAPRLLLVMSLSLIWTAQGMACSPMDPDAFIAGAVATSRKYWLASIAVGISFIILELYYKRGPIAILLTVTILALNSHLIKPEFPTPSCNFENVQGSQAVLAILSIILAYRILEIFWARRANAGEGVSN
jgi:hypothetical protein